MDIEDTGLEIEDRDSGESKPSSALERIKQVSEALSDAARRTRLSSRRRAAYSSGGFQARRGAQVIRVLGIASFFLMVVAPTLVVATYYLFIASDQFVSEADFTVSGGAPPALQGDGLSALTGLAAVAIIQDTQIVTNFIYTRAAVEKLEKAIDLRSLYSDPGVDFYSRFKFKSPIEKFVKYWKKMVDVSILMPGGIIQLKVRAFSPEDAQKIATATVQMCEDLINELNTRMNKDAVANAEQEFQRTSQRLAAALAALEVARNQSGMLETDKSALALSGLANASRATLIALQGQYQAQLKYVSPSAPQMQELNTRIEVTKSQIEDLERKLTTKGVVDPSDPTIAASMTKFGELDLERQVAERLFAAAASGLEGARMIAESKLMYLKTFISPVVPQQAQYPRRGLYSGIAFAIFLLSWGAFCGLCLLIRNYLA